jgi:hypothetical protein
MQARAKIEVSAVVIYFVWLLEYMFTLGSVIIADKRTLCSGSSESDRDDIPRIITCTKISQCFRISVFFTKTIYLMLKGKPVIHSIDANEMARI